MTFLLTLEILKILFFSKLKETSKKKTVGFHYKSPFFLQKLLMKSDDDDDLLIIASLPRFVRLVWFEFVSNVWDSSAVRINWLWFRLFRTIPIFFKLSFRRWCFSDLKCISAPESETRRALGEEEEVVEAMAMGTAKNHRIDLQLSFRDFHREQESTTIRPGSASIVRTQRFRSVFRLRTFPDCFLDRGCCRGWRCCCRPRWRAASEVWRKAIGKIRSRSSRRRPWPRTFGRWPELRRRSWGDLRRDFRILFRLRRRERPSGPSRWRWCWTTKSWQRRWQLETILKFRLNSILLFFIYCRQKWFSFSYYSSYCSISDV